MSTFEQQKLQDMQSNRKISPYTEKKNLLIETVLEKAQALDLLDKDFKSAIINMFTKGNHVLRIK